ncbi:undecaprenyldiphospho-muramoylpentapeptide beta-N-acetylglucosaminyltransferase [Rothia aerolata]|uniref:UDP-N-acetylglucosamine--N-acetylmuramyl-(pentapeptide) pyrophosphoryl-undecaprenol N-acetylglucosamine transferase n=1 Tax=Rothia aerolata TaxID=1812262 RepID=A0A917IJL7_9MICC|nr:undecaprenyldiphospho-muramoylpentapeptide beta-N-acetylglucosaminyltransferase [Rothia aerolata]GGH56480.1 UDP-N-acetylglucosamine--N-acetylmuramyl-(pentapeptide) pyrophosphoryl-undecaprenol N-acetylglucosamine transferase [Rothia aerolata]
MSESPSIVLAGGGTAGHINPMLAIAREIRVLEPQAKILMVGTENGMEAQLVPQAGYDIAFIPRVPFPRRPNLQALKFPGLFAASLKQAQKILKEARADVLVGVGGYVCTPMYLAANKLGIPVVIHEANAKPGLANKVGARKAAMVGTAFAQTPITGARHVGMPMRKNIEELDRAAERAGARKRLNLDPDLPTLVVTGGSLGAQSLNRAVAEIYDRLEEWGFQLLHITGREKALRDTNDQLLQAPLYHQVEFITGMEDVYAAADLMVVRSGAATVSEVAAVGLPAIFVPLPIGNGEQALNARSLVDAGASILINDSDFSADWFVSNIPHLMASPQRLEAMAKKSSDQGIRNAASVMAHEVIKAAKK